MAHIAKKDKKFLKGAFGAIFMAAAVLAPKEVAIASAGAAAIVVGGILLVRAMQ